MTPEQAQATPRMPDGTPCPSVMTKDEAAEFLRLAPEAIDRLRKNGRLGGCRVGKHIRFRPEHLIEFLARQEM
jgi:excisionase family DNA binding protein